MINCEMSTPSTLQQFDGEKIINSNKTSTEMADLLIERDSLRERLERIKQDYKKGLSADSEERAVELENADVLEGIAKATAEELSQVEGRLSKLKNTPAG